MVTGRPGIREKTFTVGGRAAMRNQGGHRDAMPVRGNRKPGCRARKSAGEMRGEFQFRKDAEIP
jgi:hypothetical protein